VRHLEHDWYDAPLPANVTIGARSWLYSSFAFLHHRSRRPLAVRIGDDCGIYHGTFFETGTGGEVVIGDLCQIAATVFRTDGRIEIGDHALIAHGVHIADSFAAAPPGAPDHAPRAPAETTIGRSAWIGFGATIVGGVRIGDGAIVAAGAVIDHDVPDGAVAAGNPARLIAPAAA
jgi:acetyltransferase-like isoleucine patch superfamily enzyme